MNQLVRLQKGLKQSVHLLSLVLRQDSFDSSGLNVMQVLPASYCVLPNMQWNYALAVYFWLSSVLLCQKSVVRNSKIKTNEVYVLRFDLETSHWLIDWLIYQWICWLPVFDDNKLLRSWQGFSMIVQVHITTNVLNLLYMTEVAKVIVYARFRSLLNSVVWFSICVWVDLVDEIASVCLCDCCLAINVMMLPIT